MSRWRASAIHLLISLTIFGGTLALMRLLWYPDFYFAAIGADGLLAILFGVDVVLGPMITLIIFKSGKKGLKFDLSFIAACQLVALLYGMHVVFVARPAFAVFAVDSFDVVQAVDVDLKDAQGAEFSSVPLTGPRWAAVKVGDEGSDAAVEAIMHGRNLSEIARFLVPYDVAKAHAAKRVKPLKALRIRGEQASKEVDEFLASHSVTEDEVGFLPLGARVRNMAVVLRRTTGDIVGVLRAEP
jgi:hypothetical protein